MPISRGGFKITAAFLFLHRRRCQSEHDFLLFQSQSCMQQFSPKMIYDLAKNYDSFIKAIEERRFDAFTHNKAIQKAVESYRVSDEHKAYLKTLKIK